MIETPSLIFTEMDESESMEIRQDVEWLLGTSDDMGLHSFLLKNRILSSFPALKPNKFTLLECTKVIDWDDYGIEKLVELNIPKIGKVKTFCTDSWKNASDYKKGEQIEIGISALAYNLRPEEASSHWESNESKEDGGTSYSITGCILSNIRPAECFFHLGWFADIKLKDFGEETPSMRIWIHKKNIKGEPQEGITYSGDIWIQSSLRAE